MDPAPPAEDAVTLPRRARSADEDERDASTNVKLVVALVMAAAAIVGVVLVGLESKGIYSKPVDQLVAQAPALVGRPVRVEGNLVHGTLTASADGCDRHFVLERSGAAVPVHYPACVVPPDLKDLPDLDVELTVEGALAADGTLQATQVLTKCPSRYEKEKAMARGATAPHKASPADARAP